MIRKSNGFASGKPLEHITEDGNGNSDHDDHAGRPPRQASSRATPSRTLAALQARSVEPRPAQSAGRDVPAAGQIQRRADLVAAARRRRARRPDLGRRVRPDGRHRRLRPDARRQIRDVLRAAYPRRDARRTADHGLGAASGPLQGQQAERSAQDARSPARPLARPKSSWPSSMQISRAPSWKR